MLVSKNAKICITPKANAKICVTPNANLQGEQMGYRFHWVPWRWDSSWACIFHVFCVDFIRIEYLASVNPIPSGIWA